MKIRVVKSEPARSEVAKAGVRPIPKAAPKKPKR